jgi:hypothetical protein
VPNSWFTFICSCAWLISPNRVNSRSILSFTWAQRSESHCSYSSIASNTNRVWTDGLGGVVIAWTPQPSPPIDRISRFRTDPSLIAYPICHRRLESATDQGILHVDLLRNPNQIWLPSYASATRSCCDSRNFTPEQSSSNPHHSKIHRKIGEIR